MPFIGEHLTESDFRQGAEAYIRYCSGLAVVQIPGEMTGLHNRAEVDEHVDEILGTAEIIMIDSIQRIIRLAVPGPPKTVEEARGKFNETEPSMHEIVEWACMTHENRLKELNECYHLLRPAPFLEKTTYNNICHANYQKIKTLDLLDGFVPDLRFMDILQDRTVKGAE